MGFPFWFFPLVSGVVWIGTIFGLLIPWLVQGRPRLRSFDEGQTIAFISDLGNDSLKSLFVAGAFFTAAGYLATLVSERFLRHRRLPGRATWGERALTVVAVVSATIGGAGLVLLAIFDNFNFKARHGQLVIVFIAGNLVSAAALVLEYGLILRPRHLPLLNRRMATASFVMKLIYFVLEVAATVAFVVTQRSDINLAAVLEYVTAFLFAWFIFSFVCDLRKMPPAKGYKAMPKEHGHTHPQQQIPLHAAPPGQRYEQTRVQLF